MRVPLRIIAPDAQGALARPSTAEPRRSSQPRIATPPTFPWPEDHRELFVGRAALARPSSASASKRPRGCSGLAALRLGEAAADDERPRRRAKPPDWRLGPVARRSTRWSVLHPRCRSRCSVVRRPMTRTRPPCGWTPSPARLPNPSFSTDRRRLERQSGPKQFHAPLRRDFPARPPSLGPFVAALRPFLAAPPFPLLACTDSWTSCHRSLCLQGVLDADPIESSRCPDSTIGAARPAGASRSRCFSVPALAPPPRTRLLSAALTEGPRMIDESTGFGARVACHLGQDPAAVLDGRGRAGCFWG
jgi:hypothetical protein